MLEIFGQLALATVLGALVGIERQLSKKAAGMRTFALVSLGAAAFTIISAQALKEFSAPNYYINAFQIPSQVVLGIGFIGAGLIIFHRSHVQGLTTAAGLWVAAAIGMAVGFKLYLLSAFITFLVLLIFIVFWFIEYKFVKKVASELSDDV